MICCAYFKSEREIADPQRVKIREIFRTLTFPEMIEKAILGHIYGNILAKKKHIDIEKNNTDLIVYIQPGKCM